MTTMKGVLIGKNLNTDALGDEGVEITIRVYKDEDPTGYDQVRDHLPFGRVTAIITPRK